MICDQEARNQALDPTGSFIVQAPAGSGKTELLTRRFLTLLKTVSHPEEILAVTFTRKAAGEMRHRIIAALSNPNNDDPLVRDLVARNAALSWHLIENPNRLRIMTIDALCSTIAHQMPLLSHSGGKFDITTDPKSDYARAVEKCLLSTSPTDFWNEALKSILLHFDNKVDKVKEVLALLLSKREQWLVHLGHMQRTETELEQYFVDVLNRIITQHLEKVIAAFPATLEHEIVELMNYAAKKCVEEGITHSISSWKNQDEFPMADPEQLDLWVALAESLLTKEHQWRKQFTKTTGFLSPSATKDKTEKVHRKEKITAMLSVMETLSHCDTLRDYLSDLTVLPSLDLSLDQIKVVRALGDLLPVLVGFLNILFKEKGKVDFTEVTLSALNALGDELAPTDIVMRLDYQIQHILIDEYQDTSFIQYKIFERLVSGWQPADGRTLFLVGDPMQSIYRFRGAEVNLFLRTQDSGLGGIPLQSLQLKMNFRSNGCVVNWLNDHFSRIFPNENDATLSAIHYSEATASELGSEREAVTLHPLLKDQSCQAAFIADLIEALLKKPETGRLAVLVRARNHLSRLIPVLKRRNIAFVAHDVEHLAKRPHVIDLLTLLRASHDFTDKVAWLALLRSPLVGLTLSDLLQLTQDDSEPLVWHAIQNPNVMSKLSVDARERLLVFIQTLQYWILNRQRSGVSHWIRGLWTALGGPQCYPQAHLIKDFETLFYWIGEFDQGGVVTDLEALEQKIDELYADVIPMTHSQGPVIEIMTIHKAKGLEFDTVIIPECQTNAKRNDPALLLWQELVHPEGMDLLFATSRSSENSNDKIYNYIHHLHKQKERFETARLFYVAASRAKSALHLVAECEKDEEGEIKPAPRGSFWGMLMEGYPQESVIPLSSLVSTVGEDRLASNEFTIKRLKKGWELPILLRERIESGRLIVREPNLPEVSDPVFRIIGTVFHRAMQAELYSKPASSWEPILTLALGRAGVPENNLKNAAHIVIQALEGILNDTKGQWIIDKRHRDRRREWGISVNLPQGVENIIIDFAFVDDNNIRWVVDYKIVQTQAFSLEEESEKYKAQLVRYARALRKLEKRDVRMGLYFPLQQEWVELNG